MSVPKGSRYKVPLSDGPGLTLQQEAIIRRRASLDFWTAQLMGALDWQRHFERRVALWRAGLLDLDSPNPLDTEPIAARSHRC